MPTAATTATTAAGIHHSHVHSNANGSNAPAKAVSNATETKRITPVSVALSKNQDRYRSTVTRPHRSEPGVLGGRGEECFQVVTPLRGRGLVRLDAGVVAAIEQQRSRLDFRYLGQRHHRAEHHEMIAAVMHRGHRA